MYGSVKHEDGNALLPSSVRRPVDALVDSDARKYFECFGCQAKRTRRRIWLFGGLATLIAAAYAARHILSL